jgi:hypothetical protein
MTTTTGELLILTGGKGKSTRARTLRDKGTYFEGLEEHKQQIRELLTAGKRIVVCTSTTPTPFSLGRIRALGTVTVEILP